MCWNGGIKPSILEGLQLQGSASLAVALVAHELLRDMLSSEGGSVAPNQKRRVCTFVDMIRVVDQVWGSWLCSCEASQRRFFGFVF